MRQSLILVLFSIFVVIALLRFNTAMAFERGIYITQSTAQNAKKMRYLIRESKASGINTFIIDAHYKNSRYKKNIRLVKRAGIRYVARIVVFPHGGTRAQVHSKRIWNKRLRLAKYAVSLGANAIQLDYIRYKSSQYPSKQNAKDIYKVIRYFRRHLNGSGVRLQIDIFGVAAHKPSRTIGQNIPMFANAVDAINPMVYPSHYEPFRYHAKRPYKTVLDSVKALRQQLRGYPNVKVNAYIELYNYRYPMSRYKKINYIKAQIQAAHDAGATGWYAWSARNKYALLFAILKKSR